MNDEQSNFPMLERPATTTRHNEGAPMPPEPPAPPDGGWGWLVVLGSFVIHVITDGLIYSLGVLYVDLLHHFQAGKGATSVVAALTVGISFIVGPIASLIVQVIHNRATTILGAIIAAFGFFISAWAPSIYFLYFSYGILTGFGIGLIQHPAIVVVGQYFERRRTLATGLAVCGSGVGTFLFPPLVQTMLSRYNWQGTSFLLSGVILHCAVCGALFRPLPRTLSQLPRTPSQKSLQNHQTTNPLEPINELEPTGSINDRNKSNSDSTSGYKWRLLKDPAFLLFALSGTLTSIAYNAPFLFLPHHAELHGIDEQPASFLISIIGIVGMLGRVIFGYVGDKIGDKRLHVFSAATTISGLCTALSPLCVTYTSMVLYAAAYGFMYGAYMALNWVLLVDLMGLENYSASLGIIMMFDGISTPAGPPLLGWMYDLTGTYTASFILGGVIVILSGLILCPIPWLRHSNRIIVSDDSNTTV